MRWLRVSFAVFSLVLLLFVSSGCVVCTAPTLEVFTVSDPALDPADQSAAAPAGYQTRFSPAHPFRGRSSAVLLAGAAQSELSRLAYLDVSCNLGDIRLYLPYGVDLEAVSVSGSRLYNLTSNTLYLYCPDHTDYTFYATRFGVVQYRTGNNSSYTDLTGVSLSGSGASFAVVKEYIFLFLFAVIAFCLIRGCFK